MLKVEEVSCQKGFNVLFSDITFYLNLGDIGRIIGANGKGKTSLLKIIAGISSFEGRVTFNSYPVKSKEYQQRILYLGHQSLVHNQLTARENLQYLHTLIDGGEVLKDNIIYQKLLDTALAEVGLSAYSDELTYKLSAGQKRRIILAVLFITRTKLWLLDEPFTALDTDMTEKIEQHIKGFCDDGGICLLTTHQSTVLQTVEISL